MAEIKKCSLQTDCAKCPKSAESVMKYYSFPKGYHRPVEKCTQNCMIFLLKGCLLVNSNEYAGVTLNDRQFILQAIGSKFELLAFENCECIVYTFNEPVFVCRERYQEIIEHAQPPLIYAPLNMTSTLIHFLEGISLYNEVQLRCGDFIYLKQKELSYILNCYYSETELSTFFHPISSYTNGFQYFVLQNYSKVKTVEELAHLGGYSVTTFRRLFKNMFHEPAYEWMLKKKRKGIIEDFEKGDLSISAISIKYGFDTLSHFSNFCKSCFGNSPRALRIALKNNEAQELLERLAKEEFK